MTVCWYIMNIKYKSCSVFSVDDLLGCKPAITKFTDFQSWVPCLPVPLKFMKDVDQPQPHDPRITLAHEGILGLMTASL
jgi:hypothetical protein